MPAEKECPRWRALDPEGLAALEIAFHPDLRIGPDGAPYFAGLACDSACVESGGLGVPKVARYDGTWVGLSQEGLPETYMLPLLFIGRDGSLHLFWGSTVSSFDGTSWQERLPPLPGFGLAGRTVEQDVEGHIYTAFLASSENVVPVEFSVVRLDGSAWTSVGGELPGDLDESWIAVNDATLCVAHAYWDEVLGRGAVSCFEDSDWVTLRNFDRYLAPGFGIAPDGSLYVGIWDDHQLTVMQGKQGTWREIGSFFALSTQLTVSKRGTVFAVGSSPREGTPLVAAWHGESSGWTYYTTEGLQPGDSPSLVIGEQDGDEVPYLMYLTPEGNRSITNVVKYEQ